MSLGYHGVSALQRVDVLIGSREAETNVRMIYVYFGGKDGLLDAAVARATSPGPRR